MKLRACFRRPRHRLQSGLRAIMKFHITWRHRFWRKKARMVDRKSAALGLGLTLQVKGWRV